MPVPDVHKTGGKGHPRSYDPRMPVEQASFVDAER